MRNYVTAIELQNNNHFYVDTYNAERLAKSDIINVELTHVKVGEILRWYDRRVSTLYDTDVYRYLLSNQQNKAVYLKYVNEHPKGNHPGRSLEDFDKLVLSLNEYDYDIKRGAIFIDEYNIIMEGQHRCCYYLWKYGPDFSIDVVRLYHSFSLKKFVIINMIRPFLSLIRKKEELNSKKRVLGG